MRPLNAELGQTIELCNVARTLRIHACARMPWRCWSLGCCGRAPRLKDRPQANDMRQHPENGFSDIRRPEHIPKVIVASGKFKIPCGSIYRYMYIYMVWLSECALFRCFSLAHPASSIGHLRTFGGGGGGVNLHPRSTRIQNLRCSSVFVPLGGHLRLRIVLGSEGVDQGLRSGMCCKGALAGIALRESAGSPANRVNGINRNSMRKSLRRHLLTHSPSEGRSAWRLATKAN